MKIHFFLVNTKNIAPHVLKISAISLVLRTCEITDIFNTFDEIYWYSLHNSKFPLYIYSCATYGTLPPQCHLEKQAGKCCAEPHCDFNKQFGTFTGAGTTSGKGSGKFVLKVNFLVPENYSEISVFWDNRSWNVNKKRKYVQSLFFHTRGYFEISVFEMSRVSCALIV